MQTNEFLKQFELTGDGTGFWDDYHKEDSWLGDSIRLSIAARSVSDNIPLLYQKFMDDQAAWDKSFKEFAAQELLPDLKREWDNESLNVPDVVERLEVSTIIFGWDSNADFCIWFRTGGEHGVQVYGDNQGNLIRAAIE